MDVMTLRRRIRTHLAVLVALVIALIGVVFIASPANAIVGGRPAKSNLSFLVALVNVNNPSELQCTAELISANIIITAWHCVEAQRADLSAFLEARIGSTNRLSGGTVVTLTGSPFQIPGYDEAIVQLAQPVSYKPVPVDDSTLKPGTPVVSIGWGQTSFTSPISPIIARELPSKVIKCPVGQFGFTSDYAKYYICVSSGRGNAGTGHGDSGGPLLVRGKNGSWEVAGELSGKLSNEESTYVRTSLAYYSGRTS